MRQGVKRNSSGIKHFLKGVMKNLGGLTPLTPPENLPMLPTSGNIVVETKFAPQEAKMFPKKFRNIFVVETMFPSLPQ